MNGGLGLGTLISGRKPSVAGKSDLNPRGSRPISESSGGANRWLMLIMNITIDIIRDIIDK